MITRRTLLRVTSAIALTTTTLPVVAQEPIPVVASFSILGDMVERIGGDAVSVRTLVGRDGDTHVYQPTPADAKSVNQAKLMFTNGLELEGWLDRLAEAAEFNGVTVVTTDGMQLISLDEHDDHDDEKHDDHDDHGDHGDEKHDDHGDHDEHHHGEYDPHGWLSPKNAIVYVDNITAALAKSSPENAGTFYANRAVYVAELEALDSEIHALIAALPENARTVVTSHDAFQYFGREYGLTFLAAQGISTESEASARDVAELIKRIRAEGIGAVFMENVADPRLLNQIASETGSTIGGKLYPGALSKADGPAATYIDLMRHNATTIAAALSEAK